MARTMKTGDIIRLLDFDPPVTAQVMELLSTQFTAQYMDGTHTLTFCFYKDRGDTWQYAGEGK